MIFVLTVSVGVMMGVAYVVPPGPVNIETLRRGLTGGFPVALAMQLGAVIGDTAYAVLALAGAGLLLTHTVAQALLGIVGTGLLLYLGWSGLSSWRGIVSLVAQPAAAAALQVRPASLSTRHTFWTGVAISVANPYVIAFWLSVGGTIIQDPQRHGAEFLGGFFLGSLLLSLTIALLVGRCRSCLTPRFFQYASCGCGLALIGFGLSLGYSTLLV